MSIEITIGEVTYSAPSKLRHPENPSKVLAYDKDGDNAEFIAAAKYIVQVEGQTILVKTDKKKGGK